MRTRLFLPILLVISVALLSSVRLCSGLVPSLLHGSSTSYLRSRGDLPKIINIEYRQQSAYPGETSALLSSELSRLGFSTELPGSETEALFEVSINLVQYGLLGVDAELSAQLFNRATGKPLWLANVYRKYDIYTGYLEAQRSVMQKMLDLLEKDIAKLERQK